MKEEEREAKQGFWLQHLRECSVAGEPLSRYARRHEFDVEQGYRWKQALRDAGLWPEQHAGDGGSALAIVASKSAPRFARVRIESAREAMPLRVQLRLANARRA